MIEDKIYGEDNSEKLLDYIESAIEGNRNAKNVSIETVENILPIYLKTGNLSLYDKMRIEHVRTQASKPYKVFDRGDFLEVVENCKATHPIYNDFTENLQNLECITRGFKDWKQNDEKWHALSIEGFFWELENHLVAFDRDNSKVGFGKDSDNKCTPIKDSWKDDWVEDPHPPWGWSSVPNQAGGFTGFWWYYKTVKSCGYDVDLYLQLEIKLEKPDKPEDRKLCFRVDTRGHRDSQTKIRQDCHNRIIKAGNLEAGGCLVRKPNRMGTGNTMTVALWDEGQKPWLAFMSNGGPDIPATVKNLIEAQIVLDNV